MTKHTELPWKLDGFHGKYEVIRPVSDKDICIASMPIWAHEYQSECDANATFIVKACNNHYKNESDIADLLEALRDITDKTEALCEHYDVANWEEVIDNCRKVIKQAEQ